MSKRTILAAIIALAFAATAGMADVILRVTYLKVAQAQPPTLSNLDPIPDNLGIAGAETGLDDNITTGKFLGHGFQMTVTEIPLDGDPVAAAKTALIDSPYVILDAPSETLTAIADLPEAQDAILFNATASAPFLRDYGCRANILHTVPSTDMRTDALMQVFVQKRWSKLVMISGTYHRDIVYAESVRRSATKFGLSIEVEKTWAFDADMRRNAAQEVPLFTQNLGDYDALIVADEVQDFGRYIIYNTWAARPVAGSEGLSAVTWSPVVEQWGASQLQSRFTDAHARPMQDEDYAAWAAIRTLGEAVTRTNAVDVASLRSYILSDQFELAGFKGRPLTYRPWNGQLRQPIPVVHPRAVVALAPLEGFLHQNNELDTLGLDQPESQCEAF